MESKKAIECYFTLGGINYKNGFSTSCPQQPEQFVPFEQTLKPSEIFNSERFKKHRLEMMNGKWSRGCHLCRDPEMIGSHSMRQDYVPVTNYYDPATGAVDLKGLRHVELRFSNSCNMACKHCSVVYSSGWVSKLKHYQPDAEVEKHNLLQLLKMEHRQHENDEGELGLSIAEAESIVQDLIDNFPELEKVEFAGGEVLYQKQFFPCLKKLAEHPNAENISIGFHTNFNAKFDPVELSKLLIPFKFTIIHMSLDAGTNIYPYFRTGNWETLKDNISKFRAVNKRAVLSIVCTTSAYQIMDIKNVFQSFLELDVDTINSAMCYSPMYINPSIMNIKFREDVLADIEETRQMILDEQEKRYADFEKYKELRAWKSKWNRFNDIHMALNALKEIEIYTLNNAIDSSYWEDFQVYVRKTDEIWGQQFNDYMTNYKMVDGKIVRVKKNV
jgi:MoaA/NifB/PqqE/SkfB family radical SAM enzyme